jgi:hypothetical protein
MLKYEEPVTILSLPVFPSTFLPQQKKVPSRTFAAWGIRLFQFFKKRKTKKIDNHEGLLARA